MRAACCRSFFYRRHACTADEANGSIYRSLAGPAHARTALRSCSARRGRGRPGELTGYQAGTAARPRVCGVPLATTPLPRTGWLSSRRARAHGTSVTSRVQSGPGPRPPRHADPRRSQTPRSAGSPPDRRILAEGRGGRVAELRAPVARRRARVGASTHAPSHPATADDAIRCAAMLSTWQRACAPHSPYLTTTAPAKFKHPCVRLKNVIPVHTSELACVNRQFKLALSARLHLISEKLCY